MYQSLKLELFIAACCCCCCCCCCEKASAHLLPFASARSLVVPGGLPGLRCPIRPALEEELNDSLLALVGGLHERGVYLPLVAGTRRRSPVAHENRESREEPRRAGIWKENMKMMWSRAGNDST